MLTYIPPYPIGPPLALSPEGDRGNDTPLFYSEQ